MLMYHYVLSYPQLDFFMILLLPHCNNCLVPGVLYHVGCRSGCMNLWLWVLNVCWVKGCPSLPSPTWTLLLLGMLTSSLFQLTLLDPFRPCPCPGPLPTPLQITRWQPHLKFRLLWQTEIIKVPFFILRLSHHQLGLLLPRNSLLILSQLSTSMVRTLNFGCLSVSIWRTITSMVRRYPGPPSFTISYYYGCSQYSDELTFSSMVAEVFSRPSYYILLLLRFFPKKKGHVW